MKQKLGITALVRFARNTPSAVLLAIQACILLAYPYLGKSASGKIVLAIVTVAMLGVVVVVLRRTPSLTWVGFVLGFASMVTSIMEAFIPGEPWLLVLTSVFHIVFYFYASFALIRYTFYDNYVTRDELFATAAAFTVILWAFAYVFTLVQVLVPGSFAPLSENGGNFFEMLFVSFTTLTSVGLSDILPASDQGRAVVMIGEVVGLFYMALIVTRLVGMAADRRHPRPADDVDNRI